MPRRIRVLSRRERARRQRLQRYKALPYRNRRIARLPTGMPAKKLVKLKYVDNIELNPGAGAPVTHYFSANGMFDPNITGVGHQPLYFDQWMSNYEHYQVIGSSIRITQMPTSGTEKTPALWGCILDNNTTFSYTTVEQVVEANQGKGKFRMGSASALTGYNHKGQNPRMIRKFSAKKFLGDLSDKHEGSATSNPTDQGFFGIWCGSPANTSAPQPLQFMVEISYIALLKEAKFVAQS